MNPRTSEHQTRRSNEIRADRLEQVNEWLLSMERPRPSDEDIEWRDSMTQQWNIYDLDWKLNPTGRFSERFIKESYLGGIGDGFDAR